MMDRYDDGTEPRAYPWLDEFLCEYVDGTMDPAARAAFDEYLQANPDLAAYVQRLCDTRRLLCSYGRCRQQRAATTPCQKIRPRPEQTGRSTEAPEAVPADLMQDWPDHLSRTALWAATLAILVLTGMMAVEVGTHPGSHTLADVQERPVAAFSDVRIPQQALQTLPVTGSFHPHTSWAARTAGPLAEPAVPLDLLSDEQVRRTLYNQP